MKFFTLDFHDHSFVSENYTHSSDIAKIVSLCLVGLLLFGLGCSTLGIHIYKYYTSPPPLNIEVASIENIEMDPLFGERLTRNI